MTPLRQRMIRELELQRKSPKTIEAYVLAVAQLAQYFGRSPDLLEREQVRDYVHYLVVTRKLSYSSCNQKLSAIHFLFRSVLGMRDFDLKVPSKRSGRLPEPLSRSEIARLLNTTTNRKHRVLFITCYGAGLRVSELVRLTLQDIHSDRMLIRVDQGKGTKDRFTLLSPRMLNELREYWREYRPIKWLFPRKGQLRTVAHRYGPEDLCRCEGASRYPTRTWHPLSSPFFCDASDGSRSPLTDHSEFNGTQQP